ncbi:stage III sporulation protein AF [Paenibacillus spongiae]|uniref:Stage III sporulation protein AF n=1 Tax=Paenibacillus spongiae TaxID=2909671 RepID=A0ABY5SE88_9BACL|nr:stage III sporulation protein AF [Paenibacillus spongiae]UVI32287.1 stage III sporulation protein AF [Paenibacillus spongiae]
MLAWLAAWLKQIIAVVLLAGLIDLLLPNQTMQRYVRLIAGLIILLTLLSPIIRLLQGDYDTQLNASFDNWLKASPPKEYRMPTLEDIQRDAEALKRKQELAAAALTEKQLASAMKEALERGTGLKVSSVSVRLAGTSKTDAASVQTVEVTLDSMGGAPDESPGAASGGEGEAGTASGGEGDEGKASGLEGGADAGEIQPVESVDSVSVFVQVDTNRVNGSDSGQPVSEGYAPVEGRAAEAVRRVLSEGWSVPPGVVSVRMASSDGAGAGAAPD